eukprot:scaffold746_cov123-Cylindrotheca_fusiformis.AAC.23
MCPSVTRCIKNNVERRPNILRRLINMVSTNHEMSSRKSCSMTEPIDKTLPTEAGPEIDLSNHESWRVALYYYYVELSDVPNHVDFQRTLCEGMSLNGRIRVSSEGINVVLSGLHSNLQVYEHKVTEELQRLSCDPTHNPELDIKYCLLREDLPKTKTVISLFDQDLSTISNTHNNRRSKQSNRRRRRKEQRQAKNEEGSPGVDVIALQEEMMKLRPSQHLSAEEWNKKLEAAKDEALLLDVRNVYESRVGHFSTSNVPTLLTNTRKYSDLPALLANNPNMKGKEEVFMYCTGGVRCERVSMMVQTMYPKTKVYQLKGGIQTYLRETENEEKCLFKGKNFVFDPRRTDPIHFGPTVGTCIVCNSPHDDYDNGNAPSESKEARCNTCRMLVLICDDCRVKFICWGEEGEPGVPLLHCAVDKCIHEGATPEPELLGAK